MWVQTSKPQCHHTKFEAAIDCTTWNSDLQRLCPIQQWPIRGSATTFTIGINNTNQHGPNHTASPVPTLTLLSLESIHSWHLTRWTGQNLQLFWLQISLSPTSQSSDVCKVILHAGISHSFGLLYCPVRALQVAKSSSKICLKWTRHRQMCGQWCCAHLHAKLVLLSISEFKKQRTQNIVPPKIMW
jgi:hypothetical protein